MSLYIFSEFNEATGNLTVPFSNQNSNLRQTSTFSRLTGRYPKGLSILKTTPGVVKSSSVSAPDGLPFARNAPLKILSKEIPTPSVNSVGLVWAVPNDLVISESVNERLKTNTELNMELNTYPDGVRKNPATYDPEALRKQNYADFVANIERATILGQSDNPIWRDEARVLAQSAWDDLRRKDPLMYAYTLEKMPKANSQNIQPSQISFVTPVKAKVKKTAPSPIVTPEMLTESSKKLKKPPKKEDISPKNEVADEYKQAKQRLSSAKTEEVKSPEESEDMKTPPKDNYESFKAKLSELPYGQGRYYEELFKPKVMYRDYVIELGLNSKYAKLLGKEKIRYIVEMREAKGSLNALQELLKSLNELDESLITAIKNVKSKTGDHKGATQAEVRKLLKENK